MHEFVLFTKINVSCHGRVREQNNACMTDVEGMRRRMKEEECAEKKKCRILII